MRRRKGIPFSNTKPRIEKKIALISKELLLALCPGMSEEHWEMGECPLQLYRDEVWSSEWLYLDDGAFLLLKLMVMDKARKHGRQIWRRWYKTPRREVIRHCRQLVVSGVTWEEYRGLYYK